MNTAPRLKEKKSKECLQPTIPAPTAASGHHYSTEKVCFVLLTEVFFFLRVSHVKCVFSCLIFINIEEARAKGKQKKKEKKKLQLIRFVLSYLHFHSRHCHLREVSL
jgi:hypothetical protein